MKLILRILNLVIMALAATATVFLFVTPTLSFNSNIALDVEKLSDFVPETDYSQDIDIKKMLGTDAIHVSIKFKLSPKETMTVMNGDRDIINNNVISNNVDGIVKELHEPIDLITDFSIRTVIKSTIKSEITAQVQAAKDAYTGEGADMSAEEIMEDVGMDDEYFTNFAYALYDSANQDDATIDSVSAVLYEQVDEALAMAEDSGVVNSSVYDDSKKEEVKSNLLQIFNQLKLVEDGNKIKKISEISYIYLADFLKQSLTGKVQDESELNKKAGETYPDYSDRLLNLFVLTHIPDIFYKVVGYVCLALFIGLFVFAITWAFLFIYTLFRTFSRKPWTFFGPWFWTVGIIQIALGFGLTIAGKFILPMYDITKIPYFPLQSIVLAPRTYALIPSIMFIACFVLAIVYTIIKVPAKKLYKL